MKSRLSFFLALTNKAALVTVLLAAPAVVCLFGKSTGFDLGSYGAAFAQVKAKNKQFEKRKLPGMGESVAKKVQEAYALLQPEDKKVQPQPDKAIQVLSSIPTEKLNGNELSNIYRFMAYGYIAKENYPKALENFNKVLAQSPNIDVGTEKATYLAVSQLYQMSEDYKKALDALLKWTDYVDEIKPEQHQQFATYYYQLDDKKNAQLNNSEAIRLQETAGKVPAESWYGMQRGIYLEKEDYKNAIVVVKKLAVHYPKPNHWKMLSQLYSALEQPKEGLAALEACYLMGGLTTEKELQSLAYMLVDAEAPYKAAKVFEKGMYVDKIIATSEKNLKFLADVYRASREDKKSLVEYEKAAQKSTDGDLILGLAEMYMATDNYREASKWAKDAINKKTASPDRANMTVAQAELELKNYDAALTYFKRAATYDKTAKHAAQWIRHTEREQKLAAQTAAN